MITSIWVRSLSRYWDDKMKLRQCEQIAELKGVG